MSDNIDIFKLAKEIPVESIIGRYVPLTKKSGKYYCLCPFHPDRHIGSFIVFPSHDNRRGRYKCFACGEHGDAVDFVSKFLGVSVREAAIRILEDANMLSVEDARTLREHTKKRDIVIQRNFVETVKKPSLCLSEKRDVEHLHRVYSCFIAAASPLSPQTRERLMTERHLNTQDLSRYFLFPTIKEKGCFWYKFRKELASAFQTTKWEEQNRLLLGVPGFYIGHSKKMEFAMSKYPSYGIIIYNREKQISGIQRRYIDNIPSETEKKCLRYTMLSSGFADGSETSPGTMGCSCAYIEDVLYPAKQWCKAVAVTEGRFKAEALAKTGFLVVNMHSISNWEPAAKAASEIAKDTGATRFVMCYDSEPNIAIEHSAKQMVSLLKGDIPVEFAVWDSRYGKGIDDAINAGHIDKIFRISPEAFWERQEKLYAAS